MASGIELAHRKALKAMQYICQTSKGCCNTATKISQKEQTQHLNPPFFAAIGWLGACVSQERRGYSLIMLENRTQVLITLENRSQI